jgi:uncharacterized membrane-anchored protein YhcB (DUF1043 family)
MIPPKSSRDWRRGSVPEWFWQGIALAVGFVCGYLLCAFERNRDLRRARRLSR